MLDRNGRALADRKLSEGAPPFKYDIRVTGDLYADQRDNRTATKVSVKILGNEDGDIIVEQDGIRSLASPTLSADGDPRTPRVTHKRVSDRGLELHIHALPAKQRPLPEATMVGGGGSSGDDDETPAQLPGHTSAAGSFVSAAPSRAATRISEYMRSRPISSHQSFMDLRPAFDDDSASDAECPRSDGARTPQSLELTASPVLVGGGHLPPAFESRPRSSSMTMVEEKATQTTVRGLPDLLAQPALVPESGARGGSASSRASSPAISVLRGGGALRPPADSSVFSMFSGPPVAPPERYVCAGHRGPRPRSLPRQQQRGRRVSKDGVDYRERVESLLTQYFPDEVLKKYLDELRHRYRFMGTGGMTPSEITRLLDKTTADSQLKEELRASLEALVRAPPTEVSLSDTEQTVSSSQPHYLSIRETELRDVLDRTSISPGPKASRCLGVATADLVGGGTSLEALTPMTPGMHLSTQHSTLRSDRLSVAASVAPAESVRGGDGNDDGPAPEQHVIATPAPEQQPSLPPPPSGTEPSTERARSPPAGPRIASPPRGHGAAPPPRPPHSDGPKRSNRQAAPDPGYWEDGDKYKMLPPDMGKAFTILKSQPIFIREMASSNIQFRSPFSQTHEPPSPSAAARPPSGSRRTAASAASKRSSFSERHPAESKVAKAVSELEEVLRRTETDTVESIERDLRGGACSAKGSTRSADCRHCESSADDKVSVASRDSLVGGGASSRATSVSTRISAIGAKYGMRSDSASKMSDSQSTIRTEVLMKEGMEYGDADRMDNETEDGTGDSVVPGDHGSRNGSSLSLPMPFEDMSPDLVAVLRRTGGLPNARIRRTSTPPTLSSAGGQGAPVPAAEGPSPSVRSRVSTSGAPKPDAAHDATSEQQSVRSAAAAATSGAANCSLTELDIVLGRTGGAISRSPAPSRASAVSDAARAVLSGGSGSPRTAEAPDSENELASVLRRTNDYVPPPSPSSRASSQASELRPESVASALKSLYPPDTLRAPPGDASQRSGRSVAGLREQAGLASGGSASPQPQPAARPATRSVAAGPSTYAPSPLSGPAYQPPERRPPSVAAPAANGGEEDDGRANEAPSPLLYRLPTPLFGRFPSPPPYIKNRGKGQEGEQEAQGSDQEAQGSDQEAPAGPAGPAHSRPHSQSVSQAEPRVPTNQYQEEPVVNRLDLETGSLASRRSRPRTGSEFGSASTLMNGHSRDVFDLPKVVEEDIDSLASYPSSTQARSPGLRGGGGLQAAADMSPEPGTLRGGGRLHPAFAEPADACSAGCCGVCGEGVGRGDVVVRPQVMHASCLRCEACDCLLTSSTFRAINGHVYCEKDYHQLFSGQAMGAGGSKVVAVRPGLSGKKFLEMNRAIMESFTSVDDFLLHMRELREKGDKSAHAVAPFAGDPAQVQRAGDIGVDRQTHYEREQMTSPSGTPWITERVVDKKIKTKVIEKRYPADASVKSTASSMTARPPAAVAAEPTLTGGGALVAGGPKAAAAEALRSVCHSSASRPSASLLNDTKEINGWEHPLCPVCQGVIYPNDRVTHEGYGYHRNCMRCQRCSQVTPATSAVRIKGAIYCKKHGTELLRRRSILMRQKSTMGRRSRQTRSRASVAGADRFVDPASVAQPAPPVPQVPAHAVPSGKPEAQDKLPLRVTTALRSFLEAAAEQIDDVPPVPSVPRKQSKPAAPAPAQASARRPLPVPQSRAGQAGRQPQQQQRPARHASPAPASPLSSGSNTQAVRSIFAGSRDSMYDPNVVNALRMEAQRQINGSQASMAPASPASPAAGAGAGERDLRQLLSPCGPSIADGLNKLRPNSVSSQFDPFAASQDQLAGGFGSPQPQQQRPAFAPNAQMDNLERRFRNANFRPPWALTSQSTFQL